MKKLFHYHEFEDEDDLGIGIARPDETVNPMMAPPGTPAAAAPQPMYVPMTPMAVGAPTPGVIPGSAAPPGYVPATPYVINQQGQHIYYHPAAGGGIPLDLGLISLLTAAVPARGTTEQQLEAQLANQPDDSRKVSQLFIGHETATERQSIEDLLEHGDRLGAVDEGFRDTKQSKGYDFGWIEGVYVRCTLSIFGVIMFLRLNWIFAQAGVGGAVGIILYSASVTSITTMSLSAISTNGKVAAGGVYFMVSRCLGADIGVVVGLSLFVAQALAVALNLVGFAEAVTNLESDYMINRDWDAKIWGIIGLIACFGIAFCGANFEVQSQKVLFVSMIIALLMFFIGVLVAKPDEQERSGPLSSATLAANGPSNYSPGESWVTVFGVFFPAVTGISAGSSISGDLKDASDAIPKGTFLAVATTTIIYILMGLLMAACFEPEGLADITTQIDAIDIALVPPLVYLGVFAAGLSSALALIVGAPRILMAMARDNVVTWLDPFKKGYFAMDEPLRGYCLVLAIAFVTIMSLDLNEVSPLVTNFYLVQYGFMNYAVAAAHFSKAPGWRPSFKYYNAYVSMLGAVLCGASMFMVGYVTAIITLVLSIGVYQYVVYHKPNVNWGDSSQAAMHMKATQAMYQLEVTKQHVKNWRPQYLILTGNLEERPDLIVAMKLLKKSRGVTIAGSVILGNIFEKYEEQAKANYTSEIMQNGIMGFSSAVVAPTLLDGVSALLQISGLGKLQPNTVILGFKHHWKEATEADVRYFYSSEVTLLSHNVFYSLPSTVRSFVCPS
jgi:amino acid transporter